MIYLNKMRKEINSLLKTETEESLNKFLFDNPVYPISPHEYLKEIIEEFNLKDDFSFYNNKDFLTSKIAITLEKFTKVKASLWLNLENQYRKALPYKIIKNILNMKDQPYCRAVNELAGFNVFRLLYLEKAEIYPSNYETIIVEWKIDDCFITADVGNFLVSYCYDLLEGDDIEEGEKDFIPITQARDELKELVERLIKI